jgi:hypothetical protein
VSARNKTQKHENKMTTKELDTLVNELAEDFRPQVTKIESGYKMTQNHYGRYMELLCQMAKGDKNLAMVFSLAMIKAGANREGIKSALKILFP